MQKQKREGKVLETCAFRDNLQFDLWTERYMEKLKDLGKEKFRLTFEKDLSEQDQL